MIGDLFINGKDAFSTFGVCMGDGFIDSIDAPAPTKDYIKNESRLENGTRIITDNSKIGSRSLTLSFTIEGKSEQDYKLKRIHLLPN